MPKDFEGKIYFDQDEVNKFNKEERLKRETAEKQTKEAANERKTLLGQIETMKQTAQLTDEQKVQYDKEIEDLHQKGLTDVQKQEEAITTLRSQVKQNEVVSAKEISNWQTLHHNMLVTNEIMRNLGDTEDHTAARQPDPLVALLSPKIVVEKSEDGFTPIVKDFSTTNEKGEVEKKDVSISEAVTRLFNTKQYRYLFDEKGKPGTGGKEGETNKGDGDISDPNVPPEDAALYGKWRAFHNIGKK
ncbi:MAG: hypothetical protein QQN65_03265 [Nitrosopumilus sp.]